MTNFFITKYTPISDALLQAIALFPTEFLPQVVEPAFFQRLSDQHFMRIATLLAIKSYKEGGCPIGAVIIDSNRQIMGKGHNMLVQENDSTSHGETMALRDAGRVAKLKGQGAVDFRHTTLFTTLTPCTVCCAQIKSRAQFNTVVIGDVTNAPSTEAILRSGENPIRNVIILEDEKAVVQYKIYAKENPRLHYLDWGGHQKLDEAMPPNISTSTILHIAKL